jgi:hypothetical protein
MFFNVSIMTAMAEARVIKEGLYKVDSLKLSPDTIYNIQNNSFSDRAFVLIFDNNQIIQQTIRLKPQSPKYPLIPLQSDYRIIVVGDGELTLS